MWVLKYRFISMWNIKIPLYFYVKYYTPFTLVNWGLTTRLVDDRPSAPPGLIISEHDNYIIRCYPSNLNEHGFLYCYFILITYFERLI